MSTVFLFFSPCFSSFLLNSAPDVFAVLQFEANRRQRIYEIPPARTWLPASYNFPRKMLSELWKTRSPEGEFLFVWRKEGGKTKGKKKEINYRRRYKRYALNPRTWLLFVLGNESRYHNCDNRASAKRFIETSPGNRQKKFRHGGCTLWDFVVKRWANTTLSRSFCNSCTGIFDATPRSNTMNFIEWLVEWHVNDAFMMAYSKRIEWIPPKKSLK